MGVDTLLDVKKIGRAVKESRLALDLSQEDLAKRADVSAAYVSRLERGMYEQPGVVILDRISHALGFESVDALLASDASAARISKPPAAIATSGPDERRLTPEDLEALRLIMREEVERVFRERGLPPPTEDELP